MVKRSMYLDECSGRILLWKSCVERGNGFEFLDCSSGFRAVQANGGLINHSTKSGTAGL